MSSARRLYRVSLTLSLLGAGTLLVALGVAVTRLNFRPPSGQTMLGACGHLLPVVPSVAMVLVMGLGALGTVVAALALRSLLAQLRDERRLLGALRELAVTRIGGEEVIVIDLARADAFCAGVLRPRIYVSRVAIGQLSSSELVAVVAHEAHHRANRDPLRILLSTVLADSLFFLPGLRTLVSRYRELAELAADEAAMRTSGPQAMASALLAFTEREASGAPVAGVAPERVDHLLGKAPAWEVPLSLLAGSVAVLGALLVAATAIGLFVGDASLSPLGVLAENCMAIMILAGLGLAAVLVSFPKRLVSR